MDFASNGGHLTSGLGTWCNYWWSQIRSDIEWGHWLHLIFVSPFWCLLPPWPSPNLLKKKHQQRTSPKRRETWNITQLLLQSHPPKKPHIEKPPQNIGNPGIPGDQRDLWMAAISIGSAHQPHGPVAGGIPTTVKGGEILEAPLPSHKCPYKPSMLWFAHGLPGVFSSWLVVNSECFNKEIPGKLKQRCWVQA